MQIAIDGPAGSGKSTVSKLVANKYNFIYLDTGAMYRTAALLELRHKLTNDELYVVLGTLNFLFKNNGEIINITYNVEGDEYADDVTEKIRTPEVTKATSAVSALEKVRQIMTDKQRSIGAGEDIIMDGRDIGTVVLPNADLKFFLSATPEVRAQRRALEWKEKGIDLDFHKVLEEIIERDRQDSSRELSPLKRADDAIEINTSSLTTDEVVEIIGVNIHIKQQA